MKITFESYDRKYTYESATDDLTVDQVMQAVVNIMVASGYHKESIASLFVDGDPRHWDLS